MPADANDKPTNNLKPMTDPTPEQDKSLALGKPKEIRVVTDSGPLAYIWDTARFEHMFRIAEAMAIAPIIPDHLRGIKHRDSFEEFSAQQIKGNCFRVVNQAMRWGVDPFAIVDETYVTAGKLGYQGKVVAAVINARAPIKERLKYSYTGTKGKDDYTITVAGTFIGEDEPRTVTLSVAEGKTQNQMWGKDPEQKLVYSSVIRWARRYTPELMLGVITEDDVDRMESWRAESARKANAKEAKVVEKPSFESQSDAAQLEPAKPVVTLKPEGKGKTAEKQQSAQDRLYAEVHEWSGNPETFLAGLKLIQFPGCESDVELLSELSEETCETILAQGLKEVMARIRDEQWLQGTK